MGVSKFKVRSVGNIEDILWSSGIAFDKEKTKSINSLFGKDFHESPFRHLVIQGELTCPMFVANQLKRHKAGMEFVEVSRRYTIPTINDFYCPDPEVKKTTLKALEVYNNLLKEGVPKEDARMVLPQNALVKMRMTFNLSWLLRVIKQRELNKHAQSHTRITVSEIVYQITQKSPEIEEIINKYKNWLTKNL